MKVMLESCSSAKLVSELDMEVKTSLQSGDSDGKVFFLAFRKVKVHTFVQIL